MADLDAVVEAVERLVTQTQGRLLFVTPGKLIGNPHDPFLFDEVRGAGDTLYLVAGDSHLVHRLVGARLVGPSPAGLRLAANRLEQDFQPYGAGDLRQQAWADAELLLTSDPDTPQRTRGHRVDVEGI